jgi:ABC-type Fe3+/spermidine/putrescine transport system ATPase subunit
MRLEMREEIRRIHRQARITTIYVTHDQKESLFMADRIAVLKQGVVEQVGDPRSLYRQPVNRFVADFMGETNWMQGRVLGQSEQGVHIRTEVGEWIASASVTRVAGSEVWLGFRPEAVELGEAEVNSLQATVLSVTYLGEVDQYELEVSPTLRLKVLEKNPLVLRRPGEVLRLSVAAASLLVLPDEGGTR